MVESTVACVYFLVSSKDPDVVRYVGITKADIPDHRLRGHMNAARRGEQRAVYTWMRKHLADGYEIHAVVAAVVDMFDDAKKLEQSLIAEHRPSGRLTNLTAGGDGFVGLTFTDEHKAKLRVARSRQPVSDETRAKRRAFRHSSESREKTSKSLTGRPRSDETKQKISEGLKRMHAARGLPSE